MEKIKTKKSVRAILSIVICVLLMLCIGLTLFFTGNKSASAEISVWNGELDSAGWTDTSTELWGIDVNASGAGKTAAPAGYSVNTAQKQITLASAEALAYFSHEVHIDTAHKLDGYTVTLTADVDLNNKFWIPIGSFGNRAQDKADSVDNVPRFSGTFKGEVADGDGVRAAKITNFTFDIKEVFKDATMPQYADEDRNGFKDVTVDVNGTTILLETGDEGQAESSAVLYSQIEPFMVKFETEEDIEKYNSEHNTDIPAVNTVGGLLINEDIKAYYDEMRESDPAHAAEYNMLENRFYNRIGGDCRIIYKEYNKSFADYFRANRQLLVFKTEYESQIRDGISGDNGTRPVDPESGALDTSTYIYENFRTSVDAGQVFSYGFFATTKNSTISGLRFELGNEWDFSNYGVTVLDKNGNDTGLKENLIVDQGAVLVGFGYGDLTVTDCQTGTPENNGLIKGTSYSNPAYGGLVGRMYGAHCGLPSSNPEDAAARPDEYYNENLKAEFKDCKNYVSFDTFDTGTLRCGGIAGYLRYHASYIFDNCENYGQIQAVQSGGIVGSLQNGLTTKDEDGPFIVILKNCKNFGNVESVLQDELNGTNYDLIHPNLNVRSSNSGIAGGIVGNLQHIGFTEGSKQIFENCENRGAIISDGVAGGMVAQMSNPGMSSIALNLKNDIAFNNCYNYGNITADVAFTKIPVKSELLNPNYTFTKNNTNAGALIGKIGSGTLPDGLTLRTVTYGTDENGKYLTYGVPASNNTNAYAKDKDGNYITYQDENGNTVYQRYTRNFLNQTLLIHMTGANTGNIVSANPARDVGADCVSGGGARIFLKGSYFVDASDNTSAVPNINLPEGFILWVTDAAGNGSATRNASNGSYTNHLLQYISAITNFSGSKYHYISGREGAAEGSDFNENNFPTFEWVDDMDWATGGTVTNGVKNAVRVPVQSRAATVEARATTADYTITYVANNGNNSTWVDNSDDSQSGTLANIAATKAKIKEWNDAGKTVDIVIASNVTSIAANSFYDADNKLKINSVTFAVDGTTGISACQTVGDSAFRNTEIGTVTIPHVRTVGNNAFRDSTIDEITIDFFVPTTAAAASIGTSTFQDATIGTITASVSTSDGNLMTTWSIGTSAFENAKIDEITVEDVAGIGTSAFKGATIGNGDITMYVPAAVTTKTVTIGGTAFQGATIDTLSIKDSEKADNAKTTTIINGNAFENAKITSSLTVTEISSSGSYAFQGVQAGEISLTFYVITATTANMGTGAFKGATVDSLTIGTSTKEGNLKTTTIVNYSTFEDATINTALSISGAQIYGLSGTNHSSFYNANIKNVDKIILHDITTIGANTFENLEMNEIEITFKSPTAAAVSIGANAFKGAKIGTVTIADSTAAGNLRTTSTIGANAFENAEIGNITAKDITNIGNYAFQAAEIGDAEFTWYVYEAYATKTAGIGTGAFKGAKINGDITFTDSTRTGNTKTMTGIGANAFENAVVNGDITVTEVNSSGNYAFQGVQADDVSLTFYAITAAAISMGTTPFKGATIGSIKITDSTKSGNNKTVTTVSNNAFENATITKGIDISGATIGSNAFLNATISGVAKINLHDVASVGANAFENTEINELEITWYVPAAYTTKTANMGNYVFKGATINGKITIADSAKAGSTKTTTSIGSDLFQNAVGAVPEIIINSSATTLGNYAFRNSVIGNITIGDGVVTINTTVFGAATVTTLTYYTSVTSTNSAAFTNAILGTVTFKKSAAPRPDDAAEYAGEYAVPNNALRGAKQITSVVVEEGITVLGSYAFYGQNITTGLLTIGSITLPDSLKTIGASVVINATLPAITIPANVTSIGNDAFNNYNLWNTAGLYTVNFAAGQRNEDIFTKITLADGSKLQTIGNNAFRDAHIIKMNLPNTLVSIGNYAFYRSPVSGTTKLANIFGSDEHAIAFNATGCTTLVSIGDYAFTNAQLPNFTIPASVETIGAHAFNNNNLWTTLYTKDYDKGEVNTGVLTTISIADNSNLKHIGSYAFRDTLFERIVLPASVTYIGEHAFSRSLVSTSSKKLANASAHEVVLLNNGANVENLGPNAFYGAHIIGAFHVSGDISDCSTAARFADLSKATIDAIIETGDDITVVRGAINNKLADYAFNGAVVDELTFGEGLVWIGGYAFQNAKIGNGRIVVPSTVKWIGGSAFSNAKTTDDEKVVIEFVNPASIERIGTGAFNSVNVVKLVLPENIMDCTYATVSVLNPTTNKNENVYRFSNHSSILSDTIFNSATVYDLTISNHTFGKSIFNGAHIKTLTINGNVESITGALFNTSTQIYELKIGENVSVLIDGLFKDVKIYTVSIDDGDVEGAPFEGAQIKELYLTENALVVGGTLLNNLLVGTVYLPEGIKSISAGLFTYSNIKTLVIPASVEKIEDFAFRATKVSDFRLAEGSKLKEIGAFAFGGAAIDSYILPEGLEVIGDGAFAQVNTDVTSITLPSTLTYVGVKAFGGNSHLNSVNIPAELSTDVVFDSSFDAGTAQNPLFIIAENAETYFNLKENNPYLVSEANFTYVVTVKFVDEMGNAYAELDEQKVLYGIGYSTSLVYGQWVNNTRFALPDEFYNYVWRCGDDIVSNVGNLDIIIRNGNSDEIILVGLHRVGGKHAFVARTDVVYNGTEYSSDNINALLDNRFSLIDESMEVKVIKYNQQPVENVTIKNAGTYTVSVTYAEDEDPVLFDIVIERVVTAWETVPYLISWDYSAFDKAINNINAVPNYIAADLPDAQITYTVFEEGSSESLTSFTTDENGAVVESAAAEVLNNLPVLADNANYLLNVSIPETTNYTALNDSVVFRVGVLNNTWTTSLKVMSWVKGKFDKEIENEDGDLVYPIQAAANKGDVYIEVISNETDDEGNEVVLLDRTLCGSDDLTSFLSRMDVGTYIIRATVDSTSNYTGLVETFIFRVFKAPGLPWWAVLLIVIGSLGIAALILWILHEKGVLQMLTGRFVIAMRTRMTVDATIAAVRANKRAEESRRSIARAEAQERIEAMRKAREEERSKPPEERAAALEERAAAEAAKAEKSQKRAERLQKQAQKLKGDDEVETPVTLQAEPVDAETAETPQEETTAAEETTETTDEE